MDPQMRAQEPEPLTSRATEPLLTRDYESRPTLVYERLRQRYGAVAPVDVLGVPVWLVLGYTQVLEVLRNDRGLWSKRLDDWRARTEGELPADWPLLPAFEINNSVFQEGKRLAELRGAWSAGLKPFQDRSHASARAGQKRELEESVTSYADELISALGEGGRTGWADLSAQYARPLTLMVCNRLLGFDVAHSDDALMDMWRLLDAGPDSAEASVRLLKAVSDVVTTKKLRPGDDLPSYMLAAHPAFTVDELSREILMVIGLIGDYTSALICSTAAEVIIGNAGARASLAAGMVRETINRVAMVNPPMANLTFRFATADTMLGGIPIAAGDPVMLSVAGAHCDPQFAGAARPDSMLSSRAHLAWGAGPHHCLGDELATTIVTVAVARLFDRFAGLELALPADQLPWRSSPLMRGLRSLPVRFELLEPPPRPAETPAPTPPQPRPSTKPDPPVVHFVRNLLRYGRSRG